MSTKQTKAIAAKVVAISSITLEVTQETKAYSITLTGVKPEMLENPSLLAGTLTRLLYRKLEVFKAQGRAPIALNRKSKLQIIVSYEGVKEAKRVFNVTEALNVYNVGRLFREFEVKFANYLRLIISDALKPIDFVTVESLIECSPLPFKSVPSKPA